MRIIFQSVERVLEASKAASPRSVSASPSKPGGFHYE
jgi:hypothetical protein